MLTEREMNSIRAVQKEWLPDLVDVERVSETADGFGGFGDQVWAAVETDIPARITQAQTLDMGGQAARKIELEKWTVRLPYGTDVAEGDRIVWKDRSITIRVDELKLLSFDTVVSIAGERVK